MPKVEWNRPNSFHRDSKEVYFANIGGKLGLGGIHAEIYFDTSTYPFVWRLNCAEFDISKRPLNEKFPESKKQAVRIIWSLIRQKIKYYQGILNRLK